MEQNINKNMESLGEEIDVGKLCLIITRNFLLFISVALSVVIVGSIIVLMDTPGFETSALIHIESEKGKRSPIHELIGQGSQEIQNEIEIFKSSTVMLELIEKKNLRIDFSRKGNTFFSYLKASFLGEQVVSGGPAVKSGMEVFFNKKGLLKIEKKGFSVSFENEREEFQCDWDEPCSINGKEVSVSKVGPVHYGNVYSFSSRSIKKTMETLLDSFRFFPAGDKKNPQLVRVTHSGHNPFLGAQMVNALIAIYAEKKMEWGIKEAEVTESFLEDITSELLLRLTEDREKLGAFQKKEGTVIPETQVHSLMQQVEKLRTSLRETEVKINILEGLRKKTELDEPLPSPMFVQDAALTGAINKFNTLILEKRSMSAGMTQAHPAIRKIREEISETSQSLKQLTDNILFSLKNESRGVEGEYNKLMREFSGLPENIIKLNSLKTDIKITEEIYSFLLQKLYESGIRKSGTLSGVTVVDMAFADFAEKKSPRGTLNLLIILLVAMLCSTGAVLVKSFLFSIVDSPEEVEDILCGIPVFGTVPEMDNEKRAENELQWKETFRNLHFNISFSSSSEKQVVVITSSVPSEGKSFILYELAKTCVSFEESVIIVDADIRKPTQHSFNKISKVPGLSDYLTGGVDSLDKVIKKSEGFDVIPAGEESPNPPLLFKSEKFKNMIETLKQNYKYVLIDLPPVFAVSDPVFMVDKLDVMIFVVRIKSAPLNALKSLNKVLFSKIPEEKRNIGIVINGIKPSFMSSFSKIDYHGSYCGYNYGYGKEKKESVIKRMVKFFGARKR